VIQAYVAEMLANPAESSPPQAAATSERYDRFKARTTPLHERLRAKLADLPGETKAIGLHMSAIWPMCSGVQRSKPPAHEVGAALRKLGWQRIRIYSDTTAPSGTYWFPPESTRPCVKAARMRRKSQE